jgi:hypothetical protein
MHVHARHDATREKRPSGASLQATGLTLAQEQAEYDSTQAAPLWVSPNINDTIRCSLVISSSTPKSSTLI